MTLAKMDQLTLWLETDVEVNVEVWEDTLTVSFGANSDFTFFDLQVNGVFGNWRFNQDTLTMSVKLG